MMLKGLKTQVAAALALFLSGATVAAQSEPGATATISPGMLANRNAPTLLALPSQPLSLRQIQDLNIPRGPRPGVYSVRSLSSGRCLRTGRNNTRPFVAQTGCTETYWTRALVLPHPSGGFTIRSPHFIAGIREAGQGEVTPCATVARGVVFGAARVELMTCEVNTGGSDWSYAGMPDQIFSFLLTGSNTYTISAGPGFSEEADCWTQSGSEDFVMNRCNDSADQKFELTWVAPVPAGLEEPTLNRKKWFAAADGHVRLSPVDGVDLLGPSYAQFETAADNGAYCMKRCAELAECKAWTWSGAGYAGRASPMCYWKRAPGSATFRGDANVSLLRSGIVRP